MSLVRIPNVAFFKVRSTNSFAPRPGPVQCIRNCTNCIRRTNAESKASISEDLISIKSFDNLVTRKSYWFFQYQSLQYHLGQIDLLKRSLEEGALMTVYIVAATEISDLDFLNMVFEHVRIPTPTSIKTSCDNIESILRTNKTIVIPLQLRSCPSRGGSCFRPKHLRDLLEPCIELTLHHQDFDLNIVPITVIKDHNRLSLYGLGSVCVQISEPYKLSAYLNGLQTLQKSVHMVQHICYDAAKSAIILPSHLVAFLLLNLVRENGVDLQELVDYMDWFRRTAVDIGMHIGFTGSSQHAVEVALIILDDFIHSSSAKYYRVKDIESLMDYANLLTPYVAYHGLIARAILTEYNRDKPVMDQLGTLISDARIRVMRDRVIETSKIMAEKLEQRVPCRRPCTTIERCVEGTISHMACFGRYLKIEEPMISSCRPRGQHWAGDSDDDDEDYFRRNQDNPAFKTWILVSDRDYRRDRLSLFANAIELYLIY